MITPAFSSLACPQMPLDQLIPSAGRWGFGAIELRTFGDGSRRLACEPAFTDPGKIRALLKDAGVQVVQLATGCRFDEPVFPPVLGNAISDTEEQVRAARRAIDLAASIECPLVRVFAYEHSPMEKRSRAVERIAGRLSKVCDHADRTGVRVALETGGSFAKAGDAMELIDAVNHPLLGVCYNAAVGAGVGEDPVGAINALGDRLVSVRLSDFEGERPVVLGQGRVPCQTLVAELAQRGVNVPAIIEWPGEAQPGAESALTSSARAVMGWSQASGGTFRPGARAVRA